MKEGRRRVSFPARPPEEVGSAASSVRIAEIVTEEPRLQGHGPFYYSQLVFLGLELFLAVFIFVFIQTQNSFPWVIISVVWGLCTLIAALASGFFFNLWVRANRQRARTITTAQNTYITGKPMMTRIQFGFFGALVIFSAQMTIFLTINTSGSFNFTGANHHAVRIPNLLILQVMAMAAVFFLCQSYKTLINGQSTVQEVMIARPSTTTTATTTSG